jgi:hypothetical protein
MARKPLGRATIGVVLAAALLAIPATASADTTGGPPPPVFGTITVSVGRSATLTARILATVPVDVTCTTNALAPSTTPDSTFLQVELSQAAGRSIADGFGFSTTGFVCDGTTHHFLVSVQASGCCPSPPFHGGTAIVNAYAEADWGPIDPDTGQFAGAAIGTAGPQVIRLH